MRYWGRTCLLAVCLAALCLPCAASPGAARGACEVRLRLTAEAAFEDPLARWLNELGEMVSLRVEAARWEEGELAEVEVRMGDRRAFTLRLVRTKEGMVLSSSLLAGRYVLPALCDWAHALLEGAQSAIDLPEGGRLIPVSGEGLGFALSDAAVNMRSWAALARAQACVSCEACGQCETCEKCLFAEAVAALTDAFADRFDQAACDRNVLLIDIEPYEDKSPLPAQTDAAPEAPDEISVDLLRRAGDALLSAMLGQ